MAHSAFAGVHLSTLLTGVQTGPVDLIAQAALVAAAAWYAIGVSRLARRGRRWPRARAASFAAGLVCVWIAVGSGLAAYDQSDVTLHVVQHLLLMMVAPPLLALGHPLVLAAQAAGRRNQIRLGALLRARVVRFVAHPVTAWALYLALMAAMLGDRTVYDYLTAHPLVHDAGHAVLLAVGLLYWQPLIGAPTGHQLPRHARVISVLANMPFEVLVGLSLRYRAGPIDPINSLADTQTAGEAFIVGATFVSTVWLVSIVLQWGAAALREERRALAATTTDPVAWIVPEWARPGPGGVNGYPADPGSGPPS